MKYLFALLLLTAAMTGCDPMRRINVKNNTGSLAEIKWVIKEDSITSSPLFISSSKELKFELKPDRPSNLIKMSFGIGTWSPKEIANLVDDLDSMVVSWNNNRIVMTSPEEMATYLLARRRGIDKSKIEILIRD